MALINTTTTGVLGSTFYADGSGDLTIQQNGVTINKITSAPAFSAYTSGAALSVTTATFTKVNFASENFDTANCYDTTNYRFTPNVAGYYLFTTRFQYSASTSSAANQECTGGFYKNGTIYTRINGSPPPTTNASYISPSGSIVMYLNGSTDYVEVWAFQTTSGTLTINSAQTLTSFTGCLLRTE